MGQKIGSFALRKSGPDAIISLANETLNFKTSSLDFIYDPEPNETTNRLNDGKVDRHGRFVFSYMDMSEESANCGLYRLNTDMIEEKANIVVPH